MSLKVLCDENIPAAVTASLQKWGCTVTRVAPGETDDAVAAQARRGKRILITFDSDFANILRYPPRQFSGIIRINVPPQFLNVVIAALKNVFARFKTPATFKGKLIIAEAAGLRVWEERGSMG